MKQKKNFFFAILSVTIVFIFGCDKTIKQNDSISTQVSNNDTVFRVIDNDSNKYKTVIIGKQEWMVENLNVEHYRNGDVIPHVQDAETWLNLTTGAWCYCDNDTVKKITYGKLYNWYAVNDPRGLAPKGWHIPSDTEWKQLTDFLGGEKVAGNKLKVSNLKTDTIWKSPNTGTNESGFSGLPSGIRSSNGSYVNISKVGCFWSSSANSLSARARLLYYSDSDVYSNNYNKNNGLSIRCVKD